jgi:soluble lytic murein transglycosylase-like protein
MKNNKKHITGIILHGNKFWISELLSIIIVLLLLLTLFSISYFILRNEIMSDMLDKKIAELKTEQVILQNELEHLRNINQIAETIRSFVGKNISQATVATLSKLVYENSNQFGYDPILLLAVIRVESHFNPMALGKFQSGTLSGALGLMQLKFETASMVAKKLRMKPLTRDDLFKPEINLVLGVAYLTQLVSQFKDFKLGLLAYNQGPATVLSSISKNQQLSVQYYRKVLNAYYTLKRISYNHRITQ